MKTLQALSFTFLCAALLSCRPHYVDGSGSAGTEERAISKTFKSIEIEAPVDAEITVQPGMPASVKLSGYTNLLSSIKTELRDSTLRIYIPPSVTLNTDRKISASVTCPQLSGITLSGAGSAHVTGSLSAAEFSADISGAGSIDLQSLQADRLRVDLSGTGTFKVSGGKVREAKYDLAGVGKVKAYNLECEHVSCELSGAGSAEVFATSLLDASVSGVGKITYRGEPKVTAESSGIGSISREDGRPARVTEQSSNDDDNDSRDNN